MTALALQDGDGSTMDFENRLFAHFAKAQTDDTVENVKDLDLEPIIPIRQEGKVISFRLDPISDFLALSETKLELDLKIVDDKGKDIKPAAADYAGCSWDQAPLITLIKSVDIRVNDRVVSSQDNEYSEAAYIMTLLGFDKNALDSKLESSMFFFMASPKDTNALKAGSGFKKMADITNGSDVHTVSGGIYSPLFMSELALPPMCKLNITFYLHDGAYALKSGVANGKFDYQVQGARMFFRRVKTTSDFQLRWENRLARNNAKFPLDWFYMKSFVIDAQRRSFAVTDCFNSSFVPARCYAVINTHEASVGMIGNSALSFEPNNVRDIWIDLPSERCPNVPFNVNFTKKDFVRAFRALFGDNWSNNSCIIDKNLFAGEYTIWAFDMLQPQHSSTVRSKQLGQCRLNLDFVDDSNPALKVHLLVMTHEVLEMTSAREFLKNF